MADEPNYAQVQQRLSLSDDTSALLHALNKKQREKLCAHVLAAEQKQGERVDQSIEGAVRFVPALLRKRVRKLLFD